MSTPEQELETNLREQLAELHRRFYDEAGPIIDQLTKLEAMKPRPPLVFRDVMDAMPFAAPLRAMEMIYDAKLEADRATGVKDAMFSGTSIRRIGVDEEGNLTSERIAPEDFYTKLEAE